MSHSKEGKSEGGDIVHYSVGALIKKDEKFLLIDRAIFPFGFAGIAGHVDEGEAPEESIIREIKEESGLTAKECELIFEENLDWNTCSEGITHHYWYLYSCDVSGDVKLNKGEEKSIEWYSKEEIQNLTLEPVWEYWFKKLGII